MAQSLAEVYLLAIRKSMVPVIGEAVPHPFDEQIELDTWSWTLEPAEADDEKQKKKDAAVATAKPADGKAKDDKQAPIDFKQFERDDKSIVEAIKKVQLEQKRDQKERDRAVLDELGKALDKRRKELAASVGGDAGDGGDDEKEGRYTFKFGKNVDLATTQLLNSMKSGEVFPRMVITVTHRAKHAPLNLVITFKNVTLLTYNLTCQGEETMSDVTEEWTARFEQIDYVYQNRPGIGGVSGLTQGTARVFKMNLKKLF